MSDLSFPEKNKFEKLLLMNSGYVLDFSDRTFQDFLGNTIGIDILSEKYAYSSGSKANRLRGFWKTEQNYVVGKLMSALLEYWFSKAQPEGPYNYTENEILYKDCCKIVTRLKQDSIVEHVDALKPNSDDKDFNLLAKSIKESIEKNEPEVALDRLHTFVTMYLRQLCGIHKLEYTKDEPLHSLLGKYVKYLSTNKLIESSMTEKILKFSIVVLDSFNEVRNNKSLAHGNKLLNYSESILIFNNISNIIKFIETIETSIQQSKKPKQADWQELPF